MKAEDMSKKIPSYAKTALETLEKAGYEAFLVGGCVRDIITGAVPCDYDIATSALPSRIKECFLGFRIIENGIKHGTVTVIMDGRPVEITTYRIDGTYADNRRPDSVSFTSDLKTDLSRRDFTINAMAMDKEGGVTDCFGGLRDIKKGIIRCVGDPDARFGEDGLRIMRALRFASVLGFDIDGETASAARRNKNLLDNISRERIYAELKKLVAGKGASDTLLSYADILTRAVPELSFFVYGSSDGAKPSEEYMRSVAAVGNSPADICLRFALLFRKLADKNTVLPDGFCMDPDKKDEKRYASYTVEGKIAHSAFKRLKADGKTARCVIKLVNASETEIGTDEKSLKRTAYSLGFPSLKRLLLMRSALFPGNDEYRKALERALALEREKTCLSLSDLAVNGDDLMRIGIGGILAGKTLQYLMDKVMDDECSNEKEALLELARAYVGQNTSK